MKGGVTNFLKSSKERFGEKYTFPQIEEEFKNSHSKITFDEHLQNYIDEAVYRWNTRKMGKSARFAYMFDKSIGLVRKWSEIRV